MHRKFRQVSAIALALLLTLSLLPVRANATAAADAYAAYYDLLQERIQQNGICKPSAVKAFDLMHHPDEPGLYYAEIIDMDQDNVPELVIVESRMKEQDEIDKIMGLKQYYLQLTMYTFQNGKATAFVDREVGHVFRWGLFRGTDGNVYLRSQFDSGKSDMTLFETLKDGALHADQFVTHWTPELVLSGYVNGQYVVVSSSSMRLDGYYLNGEEITAKESLDGRNARSQTQLAEFGCTDPIPADDNVATALRKIEAQLPAADVTCYYTPSAWAQASVAEAVNLNIVPQNLQKKYNQPITRQEFCQLAANYYELATGSVITARASFNDTNDLAVQKMGGLGIIKGIGGGKFAPDDLLTREQAASILVDMAEKLGGSVAASAPTFADNASISGWAQTKVGQAQASGIMGGVGNNRFDPKGSYTREQSMVTMLRLRGVESGVTEVVLSQSALTVLPGGSRTLSATALAQGAETAQLFTWSSSDPSIVSVEPNTGRLTAKAAGTAIISAAAANGITGSCRVTVPAIDGRYYCELPITLDIATGNAANQEQDFTATVQIVGLWTEYSDLLSKNFLHMTMKIVDFPTGCSYLYPKWRIYDANDRLVSTDSGSCNLRYFQRGDTAEIVMCFLNSSDTGYYRVEFY